MCTLFSFFNSLRLVSFSIIRYRIGGEEVGISFFCCSIAKRAQHKTLFIIINHSYLNSTSSGKYYHGQHLDALSLILSTLPQSLFIFSYFVSPAVGMMKFGPSSFVWSCYFVYIEREIDMIYTMIQYPLFCEASYVYGRDAFAVSFGLLWVSL